MNSQGWQKAQPSTASLRAPTQESVSPGYCSPVIFFTQRFLAIPGLWYQSTTFRLQVDDLHESNRNKNYPKVSINSSTHLNLVLFLKFSSLGPNHHHPPTKFQTPNYLQVFKKEHWVHKTDLALCIIRWIAQVLLLNSWRIWVCKSTCTQCNCVYMLQKLCHRHAVIITWSYSSFIWSGGKKKEANNEQQSQFPEPWKTPQALCHLCLLYSPDFIPPSSKPVKLELWAHCTNEEAKLGR